jgi:hypothetical protein
MLSFDKQLENLTKVLSEQHDNHFYGTTTLLWVDGNIVEVSVNQKIKLDKLNPEESPCLVSGGRKV